MEALNFQVQEFQSHPVDSLCVIFEKRSEEQKIVTVVQMCSIKDLGQAGTGVQEKGRVHCQTSEKETQ